LEHRAEVRPADQVIDDLLATVGPMPDHAFEARAAAAVAWVVGGIAIPRDVPGAPSETRDFDLRLGEQPLQPLEITSAVHRPTFETSKRAQRKQPSNELAVTQCWVVDMPAFTIEDGRQVPTRVREFITSIDPLLAEVERVGYTEYSFGLWGRDPKFDKTLEALWRSRSQFGFARMPQPGEAPSIETPVGAGGMVTGDLVVAEIEAAADEGNCRKLDEPPDAEERHLFVHVSWSTGAAAAAVTSEHLTAVPTLPSPITTVWVSSGGYMLFSCRPPALWVPHEVLFEVFEHPERWIDSEHQEDP
jgi:hypothetical protein